MDLNHPLLANGALDDPPPFPANQPHLQRLDRALQCQICKEPFSGPVSIACGHSFCSQCIRSSLDSLKKCPSCGEPASEGGIRRNRALEEMVDAWEEARPVMITLSKPAPSKRRAEASAGSGRVKRLRLSDGLNGNSVREASRSRSTSERPLRVGSVSGSASPEKEDSRGPGSPVEVGGVIELGSSDAEEEMAEVEAEEEEEMVEELSENDEGECPICQARLPIASIPAHVERNCEPPRTRKTGTGLGAMAGSTSGNAKADWKKVFGGVGVGGGVGGGKGTKETPLKRLTKPNLSLSTPASLRTFLTSHSLPITGDRPQLESRVSEWILLYNSNLDTSHPRSLPALRARLAESEAARKRDKEKGKDALGERLGTKEGMREYAKERKGEFERLREAAMRGRSGRKGAGEDGVGVVDGEARASKGGSEGAAIVVD